MPNEGSPVSKLGDYPDISDILARKAQGRKNLAALSFGEKIARMEALRARLEPFKHLRRERQAAREAGRKLGDVP